MIPLDGVRLVAFDLDGVIADTEPLHKESKRRMFLRRGLAFDGDLDRYIGLSNEVYWTEMRGLHSSITETLEELEAEQFRGILELLAERRVRPSAGLAALLERLASAGVACGLYSSSLRFYVDRVLEFFGIAGYFSVVLGGDDVPRRKPFPDGYVMAARLAGVEPSLAVAIEDSTAGVAAGVAAGMRVIGYRNPTSGGQDLSRANWIVDSLTEV